MSLLTDELNQQPAALRCLVERYRHSGELTRLGQSAAGSRWVLTGMGASYHAACLGALYLNAHGVPAVAMEASDLTHYALALKSSGDLLVYLSQSGSSGEVPPFLDALPTGARLVGITNHSESLLARKAQWMLHMEAGDETLIASKTYLNSLALLWLLSRQASANWEGSEWDTLLALADRAEELLAKSEEIGQQWLKQYASRDLLLFLGHGPHAVTARQSAMTLSEWAKKPTLHASIGAFRHGFIEAVQPGLRAVVFAPPGRSLSSSRALSRELALYGVSVGVVQNGELHGIDEVVDHSPVDELLSPILDIIPIQLFADALAASLGIAPGFRYIGKVVTQL
jgi:glucosamine--fructose-6-phosphate aminotransferase (isomerizing)